MQIRFFKKMAFLREKWQFFAKKMEKMHIFVVFLQKWSIASNSQILKGKSDKYGKSDRYENYQQIGRNFR